MSSKPKNAIDAVYTEYEPDVFKPSGLATGPWPALQGGGAAGIMAMAALKRAPAGFVPVSFRADFLKMMPVKDVRLSVRPVREAKTTAIYDMELMSKDESTVLSRATITLMKSKPADAVEAPNPNPWGGFTNPEMLKARRAPSPHGGAWLMDALDGRQDREGVVWFRWTTKFLANHENDWFARVLGPADWTHGIARPGYPGPAPVTAWPNTDLSVHVDRPLVGDWVGLRPRGRWHPAGRGIGYSDLMDQDGCFGRVAMSVALIV